MTSHAKGLRIALVHNLKRSLTHSDLPPDYFSECDKPKTLQAISHALRSAGHKVFPVEADQKLAGWLVGTQVDLAFNIAEGFSGEAREARVPALLELLEIPYTGSGVLALALALDKAKSKTLFRSDGIPTPNFQLFSHPDEPLQSRLQFPLIVKPNCEGSAKGIWASSVVRDERALRAQVRVVFETYAQKVLVEEYIEGKELSVGILGNDTLLPVLEIDFGGCEPSGEFFYSWRMKEFQGNKGLHLNPKFWCPARLDPKVSQAVQSIAWRASKLLETRDLVRVDLRLSVEGIPYVLEVNPLPGLDPKESGLSFMAQAAGISYPAFIQRLVHLALGRSKVCPSSRKAVSVRPRKKAAPASLNFSNGMAAGGPALARGSQTRRLRAPALPNRNLVPVRQRLGKRRRSRQGGPKEGELGR